MLAVGRHDSDYVDAYYGPDALKAEVDSAALSLADIERLARALVDELGIVPAPNADELGRLRHAYLRRQLESLVARVRMLRGESMSFDDEARALYDVSPPRYDEDHFRRIVARLDDALPGRGPVPPRYVAYRERFAIPRARLDAVFSAAIDAGRERTRQFLTLPPDESFAVEYVTDRPWSGYNWYKGGYHSVIQVNTGLPIYIDRAVDLACHEGYPGHHVYNALLEHTLVRERGWPEFTVYALFSPQSLIAEGSANYGIEMAFPGAERVDYEREILFPIAGLPASDAADYYHVLGLVRALSYAGNEAARGYLDGVLSAADAVEWLERYAMMSPAAATQRIRFFDTYRSYVVNYNVGQDLVREYVERVAGPRRADRWRVFGDLLSSPRLPSSLT